MNRILTTYDWIYGIAQFASAILSIIAGIISARLFYTATKRKTLLAWKYLALALVLFTIEEVLGMIEAFGTELPGITHAVPTIILALLITAIVKQIYISKGYTQ